MTAPPSPLDYTVAHTGLRFTTSGKAVPVPACNPGDLLVMTTVAGYPFGGSTVHPVVPSGWTPWQGASGARQGVWTKVATTSDAAPGATVQQQFDGAAAMVAQITSYPAATVSSFAFDTGSPSPSTRYTPVFPSGVRSSQMVLFCAGARTSLTAPDATSGVAAFQLPGSPWVLHVPPIGPSFVNSENTQNLPALGTAAAMGAVAAPTMWSVMNLDMLAGFLILTPTGTAPSWLRVTAKGGPGAGVGMALTVKALSGAGSQAGAATAVRTVTAGSAVPTIQITPNFTGSLVYGAAYTPTSPAAPFTADAGTAFSQSFTVTTAEPSTHGTFRSAGTTTSGSVMGLGSSTPSTAFGIDMAAVEIRGSGLAEIGSALKTAQLADDYPNSTASQTAILTSMPPSGTLLVAMVTCSQEKLGGHNFGTPRPVISDTLGLAWTEVAQSHGSGYAGVWTAVIP
jgi:hypothetical protein